MADDKNPIVLVDKNGNPIKSVSKELDEAAGKAIKFKDCLKGIKSINFQAVSDAFGKLDSMFQNLTNVGAEFDAGLREVSAITGIMGDDLDVLGDKARDLATTFGTDATDNLNVFKTVLSRLGPQIGEDAQALNDMGKYANTLAKTMGGDIVGATDVLTSSLLQFGVDLNNPITASQEMERMMNAIAAVAGDGAAKVPSIAQALKQVGGTAKMANVSFEETNAALQALARSGIDSSEAGVALSNAMIKMSAPSRITQEASELLQAYGVNMSKVADASVPFADRLQELQKIGGDTNALAAVFGDENVQGAQALINSAQYQRELTQQITGTNVAYEKAEVVMGGFTEMMSRMRVWFDDLKIAGFDFTSVLSVVFGAISGGLTIASDFATIYSGLGPVLKNFCGYIKETTLYQKLATVATAAWAGITTFLNAAFVTSPIGWVVLVVGALVAAVAVCWNEFAGFRAVILTVWDTIKGFGGILKDYVIDRIKGIISGLGLIGSAIGKLFTGDFSGAFEDAKQGLSDFYGIEAAKKAFSASKEVIGEIGVNYDSHLAEETAKQAAKEEKKEKEKEASAAITTPSAEPTEPFTPTVPTGGDAGAQAGASAGKVQTINISIANMIGTWNAAVGFNESRASVEDKLAESLARILGMAETSA
jgi:TP901 family phage tail tape measure protein